MGNDERSVNASTRHGRPAPTVGDRVHAAALGAGVAVVIGYWVSYYTSGAVRTSQDPAYDAFEQSFVAADAYMDALGIAAAVQLWRGRPSAVPLGIAGGSALTYLGLMDVRYNLQHGKYAEPSPEMALEAALNVASLTLGPITMVRLWRARHRLGA